MDIFTSARAGLLEEVRYFTEVEQVELNQTDFFNATPLYYACLGGHPEVVQYLLSAGAVCNEGTFDGERCLYAAHTDSIRNMLRDFKQVNAHRHDPFSNFLREIHEPDQTGVPFDVFFTFPKQNNIQVGAHKAILACRCKFFCEAFQGVWGKDHSTVVINNRVLNPTALQGLFEFLYTNRIDLPRSAWEDFKKLCKQLKMLDLFNSFEKSIKQGNLDVQVLIYDRTSARLLSDLRNDFYKLLELSNTSPEQESQTLPSFSERVRAVQPLQRNPKYFPDLCLVVEGYSFFCHKIFLHYRSDYFRTLFSSGFLEANSLRDSAEQHISDCPVIRLSETRSEIMGYLLEFIYSNNISRLEEFEEETLLEIFYAADMYLIPQLQTTVGFYLIRFIRLDNALSYWSLAVDFDLKRLEKSSMEFIALNLQEFLKEKEFLEIVSQSASEIQNRQEVDSIPVIDDIRFILNKYIARYPESHPDHLRLIELEEALAVWLENTNFDC